MFRGDIHQIAAISYHHGAQQGYIDKRIYFALRPLWAIGMYIEIVEAERFLEYINRECFELI